MLIYTALQMFLCKPTASHLRGKFLFCPQELPMYFKIDQQRMDSVSLLGIERDVEKRIDYGYAIDACR
jgi:hypothetical protein